MPSKKFDIALILSAVDKASAVVNATTSKIQKQISKLNNFGTNQLNSGLKNIAQGSAMAAVLYKPIKSFAEMENASTRLMTSLMDNNGRVSNSFYKIQKLASELGGKLPGTTADFNNLFNEMIVNGARAQNILNGTGRAAAYMAVAMKMPFEVAGGMAQRLQTMTGTADNQMLKFLDHLSRTKNIGVDIQELEYAFGKSAGTLKTMGLQGLEASKKMSTLFAILKRDAGMSGETMGTSMAANLSAMLDAKKMAKFKMTASNYGIALDFINKKTGQFKGIDNMFLQFDKLNKLNPQQLSRVVNSLTGGGQDSQAMQTLIHTGSKGFAAMNKSLESKASLDKIVKAQLGTVTNMAESAAGAWENTMATFAATNSESIKDVLSLFGKIASKIESFVTTSPKLAGGIFKVIAAFATLKIATGSFQLIFGGTLKTISTGMNFFKKGAEGISLFGRGIGYAKKLFLSLRLASQINKFAGAVGPITKLGNVFKTVFTGIGRSIMSLSRFLIANPIILIIAAIAVSAYLMYKHWDKIKAFFIKLWGVVKNIFKAAWQGIKTLFLNYTPYGLVIQHWSKITAWFAQLWENVKVVFNGWMQWLLGIGPRMLAAGRGFIVNLWNGIKEKAQWLVDKVKGIAQKIRDLWPFSPAKAGPLRDIHKIKLMETIAATVRPVPMLNAMRNVQQNVGNNFRNGLVAPLPVRGGDVFSPNINFTINLSGSANDSDAKLLSKRLKDEFEQLMRQYDQKRKRVAF